VRTVVVTLSALEETFFLCCLVAVNSSDRIALKSCNKYRVERADLLQLIVRKRIQVYLSIMEEPQPQRKEIYTYKAPWTVFSLAWSNRYVFVLLCII